MPIGNSYEFGPFRFDAAGHLLFREGKPVHLKPKEAEVLSLLLEKAGDVVSQDELLDKVWGEVDVGLSSLTRTISDLRKALGDEKKPRQYVETVSKVGYRFVAKVKTTIKIKLVVLPFENFSKDKDQEYFNKGLTEEMITELGRLNPERLGVIARYKPGDKTIEEIGRELQVAYVLEGSVQRVKDRVRITVQLIQVSDQSHVWGKSYERDLRDIFALQSDVARAVAQEIQIKLTPHAQARLERTSPINPAAFENYLKGRYLWDKRTPETLKGATVLFEKAITQDRTSALAYSALADCYAVTASQSWIPPRDACAKARMAAEMAVQIDKTFAEPHASLGFVLSVFERQWPQSEHEFQEAIRLNSSYATGHQWYAFYLAAMKRLPEAIQESKKAQELDPLSRMINTNVGTMLYWARKYDDALGQYDEVLSLDQDFWYAYWMRGMAHEQKGQYQRAVADQQRAMKHFPGQSPLLTASLARSLALSGEEKEARRLLKGLGQSSKHSSPPYYHIALAYAALAEREVAFRFLQHSSEAHEMWVSFIEVDPKMDALRREKRYAELRRVILT